MRPHTSPAQCFLLHQDTAGPHASQSSDEAVNPAAAAKEQDVR